MADENECNICCEELSEAEGNLVKYRKSAESEWQLALCCETCLRYMMDQAYDKYFEDVTKADCARNLRALLDNGPPDYFHDVNVMPLEDGERVHELLFTSTNTVETALVKGAKTGEARQAVWVELRSKHGHRLDSLPELAT
eukprot:m.13571 g.13571  ORF g.13571 m.13571 type:complete len:141 (+) comp10183_c0_seq2:18-440(+)